jgi:class 3 adenylate cyclase
LRSDHTEYNLKHSLDRIASIFSNNVTYQERERIPQFNELSYTNGFYAKCSAICVDIRKTPQQTDLYTSKELAKIYRAYISEVTAVINGNQKCAEINIAGDCIKAVFDVPFSEDLDDVFSTTGKIASIIDIINERAKKLNLLQITVGIGMAYGKALVRKVGYKGSNINEVIWTGEALDEALRLASYGNKDSSDRETMVSEIVYYNLNVDNQKILSFNSVRNCFHGDTVNAFMNNWFKQNASGQN